MWQHADNDSGGRDRMQPAVTQSRPSHSYHKALQQSDSLGRVAVAVAVDELGGHGVGRAHKLRGGAT